MIVYTIIRDDSTATYSFFDVLGFCWTDRDKAQAVLGAIEAAAKAMHDWDRTESEFIRVQEAAAGQIPPYGQEFTARYGYVGSTRDAAQENYNAWRRDQCVTARAKAAADAAFPRETRQVVIGGEELQIDKDVPYTLHEMVAL